jgi:hypothetical protein
MVSSKPSGNRQRRLSGGRRSDGCLGAPQSIRSPDTRAMFRHDEALGGDFSGWPLAAMAGAGVLAGTDGGAVLGRVCWRALDRGSAATASPGGVDACAPLSGDLGVRGFPEGPGQGGRCGFCSLQVPTTA